MTRFDKKYKYEQKLAEAKSLFAKGKVTKAEKILRECFGYFDDEHLISNKLDTITNLINLYIKLEDFERVDSFIIEYESESKEHKIEIPLEIFHNLGKYFSKKGDVKRSIAYYEKAVLNKDPLQAAKSHFSLGQQLQRIGQFDCAARAFIISRDIFLKYNRSDLSINPFQALTAMLMKLRGGSIPIDLNLMEFVLENSTFPKSPNLAKTYINVGLIFQITENYQKAIYYLKKAIEISVEIKNNDTLFHAYLNLGFVYITLSKYPEAKNNIEKALNYFRKKKNTEFVAKAYNGLALIYKESGELDISFSFINKSIEISKEIIDFELHLRNNEILADLYKKKKEFEKSFLVYIQILKIYKKSFDRSDLLGLKQIFREQFSRILSILKNLNALLNSQDLTIQSEVLEDVKDDVVNICRTGVSKEILEDSEKIQLKEQVIELIAFINKKDKEKLEN
ncbi:hypothetical protein LCGC14_1543060 [marine sediment metagenome]|uniref:MalT-like TPR region domain-containing protein n=1 Tax=marine sediment metagenome TaxID=412755 RepID=A0A0F9L8K7_9ZZZZ